MMKYSSSSSSSSSSSQMPVSFSLIINTFVFLPLILLQFQIQTITANEMDTSCAPFSCGNFKAITYPFWSLNTQPNYCGHPEFKLDCQNGSLTMEIKSQKFHIIYLNQTSKILRIARIDLFGYKPLAKHSCPKKYINVNIDLQFFKYTPSNENYTLLYECGPLPDPHSSPLSTEILNVITCLIEGKSYDVYLGSSAKLPDFAVLECKNSIQVPGVKNSFANNSDSAVNILNEGFEVQWSGVEQDTCDSCMRLGERCGYNISENAVMCLSKKSAPPENGTWNWKKKLIVGAASAVLVTLAVITAIYFYRRQNSGSSPESHVQSLSLSSQPSENFGVKIFTVDDLDEATEHFRESNKLGGGFSSTVYDGKLKEDGRRVAVKVLGKYTQNRDALFMTEVRNLANLSHENLVVLYGCTSPHITELMLVYQYVGQSTLYHHLRHPNKKKYVRLTWDIRMRIAVETARALRYLHASNIVHRDVKPSNILLTDDFHVKLGDFGLARPFPEDQSRVETGPKGTLGYVDPEYCRQSELTHKSDVFSFGVVMIELISSKPVFDNERSDHQLSDMAKNKFENKALDQLMDDSLGFGSDLKVEEMMRGVAELAVRCVQDSKDMRPSMNEVLEALENIQSLGQPEAVDNYNADDDDEIMESWH